MANEYILKEYDGNAVATLLNGGISGAVTTIVVDDGSSWPDGSTGAFVLSIDRTTLPASEEVVLCTARAGNSCTVQRGYGGTSAVAHLDNASVEHVMDIYSIKQANVLANRLTTKGDTFVRDNGTTGLDVQRLAVGANGSVYTADSTQTLGIKWATKANPVVLTDAAQSINDLTVTDITWGTEVADVDAWHAAGVAAVVVPAGLGGRYLVTFTGIWQGVAVAASIYANVNGAETYSCTGNPVLNSNAQTLTFLRTLVAGDSLVFRAAHNNGGAVSIVSRLEIAPV